MSLHGGKRATALLVGIVLSAALGVRTEETQSPAAPPAVGEPQGPAKDEAQKKRAQEIYGKLVKKYGEGLLYEVDDSLNLVFATNTDPRTLKELKERLTAHAQALRRDLFEHGLEPYLAVVVPKKWPGDVVSGHFYPGFVDARTIGSSLMHEFTHALHFADQQARGQMHPIWIVEGLASLYENAKVVVGHAAPQPNHKLIEVQGLVRDRKHIPLEKLVKFERRQFTSHHYGQARYMFMYLYDTGRLKEWYDACVADYARDSTGAGALEKVFGKKLPDIEKDWAEWVLKLTPPVPALFPGSASLGIRTRQQADGIQIESLLPGGGAEQAGLAAGDVLTCVDGERVWEGEDLLAVISQHKVGDKVKVEYRCDGEYRQTTVALTPLAVQLQEKPPAPTPAPEPREKGRPGGDLRDQRRSVP